MQNDCKQDKLIKIVLIMITIVQVCAMLYAIQQRGGLHIDEYYSHGLMQYDNAFIIYDEDFYNQWHNKQYFEDYLSVNTEDVWDFSNVYKNQILDVHPPLYYLLLRIVANFNLDRFSIWPGSILNVILFVCSTVVLFKVASKVMKNKWYAIVVCLMNGLCIGVIETVMFIRMYQLTVLNVLLLMNWHLAKKEKELEDKDLVQLGILIITGFLTHYYYAIIVAILYGMYMVKYIRKKQMTNMIKYTAVIAIAVLIAVLIFPYCIEHIFFGYRGQQSFGNIRNWNRYEVRIKGYAQIIEEHILIEQSIFFAIILGLAIWTLISKKCKKQKIEGGKEILYILIPTILYTAMIVIISVYIDFRYIMPVIPFYICLLVYGLKLVLEEILNKKAIYAVAMIAMVYVIGNVPKIGDNLYTLKTVGEFTQGLQEQEVNQCLLVDELLPIKDSSIMTMYDFYLALDETYVVKPKELDVKKVQEIWKEKEIQGGVLLLTTKRNLKEVVAILLESGIFQEVNQIATSARYEVIRLK